MEINESVLQPGEKILLALREIYAKNGYAPYRMSKFEEYDLYAGNKDFLVSDNVITFTDTSGKLMALKPDVTLSIIKNSADDLSLTNKIYYNENVYRVSKSTGSFKEIMQSGIECFGKVGQDEIVEVLSVALACLDVISPGSVLAISDLALLTSLINKLGLSSEEKNAVMSAVESKNIQEIDSVCARLGEDPTCSCLKKIVSLQGKASEIMPRVLDILSGENIPSLDDFRNVVERACLISDRIYIDFSVIGDTNYYNGIVFKGFIKELPGAILSGGQYDNLMRKLGRRSSAIGFAVYTDALERISDSSYTDDDSDSYINVALPKGRLGEKVYDLFARAGYECPSILENSRKLIFENPERKVRYFWVKPSDVPIYVERGAADIGVAGKDILLEYQPDIYELLDLKKGKCRMAVAACKGYTEDMSRTLVVATKFANIAKSYYLSKGRDIDIIHLNGSIEIAPILGLSDVIVDIVETGTTLRENNLEVIDTIVPISARLIANKSSSKFKTKQIQDIAASLSKIIEGQE